MSEVERYNEAWKTGEYDPMIGLLYVRCLYRMYFFQGYKTLLDVGCGTGAAVRYHREIGGIEAYGIDFAGNASSAWGRMGAEKWCRVASAEDIPFKDDTFDMVTCTDVLEHVPEDNVNKVLSEIYRVGKGEYLFTIALNPATIKMPDGTEPHITLKPPEWWLEKMVGIGYRFRQMPFANHTLCVYARKNEDQSRHYKPLQQSLLHLPDAGKVQRVHFPHRIHGLRAV